VTIYGDLSVGENAFRVSSIKYLSIIGNVELLADFSFRGTTMDYINLPENVSSTGVSSNAFFEATIGGVYYPGSTPISTKPFQERVSYAEISTMCASPDYPLSSFGGMELSDSDRCRTYKSNFNHCFSVTVKADGSFVQVERKNVSIVESESHGCVLFTCDNETGKNWTFVPCGEKDCYVNGTCNETTGDCEYDRIDGWQKLVDKENQCFGLGCEDGHWIIKERENATEWEHQTNDCVKYFCENSTGKKTEIKKMCDDRPACWLGMCNETTGECDYEKTDGWQGLADQENKCYELGCDVSTWIIQKRESAVDWELKTNDCYKFQCENSTGGLSWRICNTSEAVSLLCMESECLENWESVIPGWFVQIKLRSATVESFDKDEFLSNISNLSGLNPDEISYGDEVDSDGNILTIVLKVEDQAKADSISEAVKDKRKEENCSYGILCMVEETTVSSNGGLTVLSEAHTINPWRYCFLAMLLFVIVKM